MSASGNQPQLLHPVLGGEVAAPGSAEFRDLSHLDIVGAFPNYASAYVAPKAMAQNIVDNTPVRYFIVHLHRLLDSDGVGHATR